MQLEEYVRQVHDQLRASAALGDERTQQVASALAGTIDSSVRLALLAAVSAAAGEITAALFEANDGPAVTVALDGDEIRVDITRTVDAPPTTPPSTDDGEASARISLRLSERLKADVEQAAGRDGVSVNTWLVRAASAALTRPGGMPPGGGWPGPWSGQQHGRGAHRVTGWVTG
jgi:hypothetical protein